MTQTSGFTLIEVLVVIALIAALTAAVVAHFPRANTTPANTGLPDRLSTLMQAAYSQAYGERTTVTLTGQGNRLLIVTSSGTEPESFEAATLTGTLQIATTGTTSGQLQLQAPGLTCTRLTLDSAGNTTRTSC